MKTYILGDIHGEYKRCCDILKSIGLINDEVRWTEGLKATLIQTGDVVDRGKQPVESFMLLRKLQESAENEGGRVIRILGNHELNYIGGPFIADEKAGHSLSCIIKKDITDGRIVAAHRLDDWLVVHAGVMPHIFSSKACSLKEIDELIATFNSKLIDAVNSDDFSDKIFFVGSSRGGYQKPGIFWADYDVDLLPCESDLIKQIVGHTPPLWRSPGFSKSPQGKIINVDIGMCSLYGGNKGIMLYEDKEFKPVLL